MQGIRVCGGAFPILTGTLLFSPHLSMRATSPFAVGLGAALLSSLSSAQEFLPRQAGSDKAPRDLVAADLDGDGDLDLLVAHTSESEVAWLENSGGTSAWTEHVLTTAAGGTKSVAAADLDGDGDLDVLVAAALDSEISWIENLGGGVFAPELTISLDVAGASDVTAGDLDGDGDLDVIAAGETDAEISWFQNLGAGSFGSEIVVTIQALGAHGVEAADLDDDGDLDLISVSGTDGKVATYENLGAGSFGGQQVLSQSALGSPRLAVVDLDGDGDPDIVSTSQDKDEISWFPNLMGTMGPRQLLPDKVAGIRDITVGDLDGDGDHDVIAGGKGADTVCFENLGGGLFAGSKVVTSVEKLRRIAVDDIDGDGDLDFIAGSAAGTTWFEQRQSPTLTLGSAFAIANYPAVDGVRDVTAADLDGDGDLDAISASVVDSRVAWYKNMGGYFATQVTISTQTPEPWKVVPADVDGDLDLDLLVAGLPEQNPSGKSTIDWYENDGTGVFAPRAIVNDTEVRFWSTARDLSATDVDGDGDVDILVVSQFTGGSGGDAWWMENLGGGAFGPGQLIWTGANGKWASSRLALADLDGDGLEDLIAGGFDQSAASDLKLGFSIPGGGFGNEQLVGQYFDIRGLAAIDADQDGDLDVLFSDSLGTRVAINQAGVFGAQVESLDDLHVGSISAADLDGDGDLDWLTRNHAYDMPAGAVRWRENTGGTVGLTQDLGQESNVFWLGDLDGDGDADLLSGSDGAVVWRRNGTLDCNGNGIDDASDISNGTSTDCDGNGRPDECDLALGYGSDCNSNGVLDACDALFAPGLDWNGNAVLDDCEVAVFCKAAPNSTGNPGMIGADGSPSVARQWVTLQAWDLPQKKFAYFVTSESSTYHPSYLGSGGNLCLGGKLIRFASGGQILFTGSTGSVSLDLDLDNLPKGISFDPGDTWYFQLWYRDKGPLNTSNFSHGLEVLFR